MAASKQKTGRIEFTNHLMFNAVLSENEDLCKRLIGAVLGKTVEHVEFIEDEVSLQPELDSRGARLDVLALIDGEYADVEMQLGREPDIARRCRFYHSAIAARFTPKGLGYGDVPRSYVIFICLEDPLGEGLPRYELATTCQSMPELRIDDGATSVLLNAQAWQQEENPDVAGMLQYALTGHPADGLAVDIAAAVDGKNEDRKWVRASMGVMTYEHEFIVLNSALEKKDAELARKDAEQELAKKLHAAGRTDEYFAALDDPELMDALLAEFA